MFLRFRDPVTMAANLIESRNLMSPLNLQTGNLKFPGGTAGIFIALLGATLWGVSGTVSSILFRDYGMPFTTLVSLRMLLAGIIALAVIKPSFPSKLMGSFIIFAIFWLFGVHISYLATIDYSNAPTATLLQYLFFPMVLIYEGVTGKIRVGFAVLASVALALAGTFELTTGFPGHSASIILSPLALIFGIISAITAALYTIMSAPLIKNNGTASVITWAFILGGLVSLPFSAVQSYSYFIHTDVAKILPVTGLVIFVAVFGTLAAFGLYIRSMQVISATQASLAGTMEPISAAVSSALLLGVVLTGYQYMGGTLIVLAIIVVQISSVTGYRRRTS